MTHIEAREALAIHALDALDPDEAAALEAHLAACSTCTAELASLRRPADEMAAAAPLCVPPARLRARVVATAAALEGAAPPQPVALARVPERRGARHWLRLRPSVQRWQPAAWLAAAVLLLALSGAGAGGYAAYRAQQQLAMDEAALALLTSTETVLDRLAPAPGAAVGPTTHGHWYHRAGVPTQVIVGEALLPLPAGERYVAWLQRPEGWQQAGALVPDAHGSARLVVLGHDPAGTAGVLVTRETDDPIAPRGPAMLRFPG